MSQDLPKIMRGKPMTAPFRLMGLAAVCSVLASSASLGDDKDKKTDRRAHV